MNSKIHKTVTAAMFASLVCVATMIIKIPSPLNGYINPGDSIVLLSGWLLSPVYGFMAAGIGSALADIFAGYVTYAPATFIIKGIMAIISYYGFKIVSSKVGDLPARVISGVVAEIIMISGYFVFEGFLYGFMPSTVNIPANTVQGAICLIIGCMLIKLFGRNKKF